jgi:hypothetical protein
MGEDAMQEWDSRRWTGVVGFVWVVVQVVGVVLFLAAGNPPDFGDPEKFAAWIETNSGPLMVDAFLTAIGTLPLLGLFAGVRSIIASAGERWAPASVLFYGAGTTSVAVLIVAAAAEATSALLSRAGSDPATVGAAWVGTEVLLTFVYFPSAVVTGVLGYVTYRTGILPRWLAWLSGVATVLELLAGLTVFGGTGSYGPLGLLPIILGALPVFVWAAALSSVLLRSSASAVQQPDPVAARPHA